IQGIRFVPLRPGRQPRETNQIFQTDNIHFSGRFSQNFNALKETLKDQVFVMFYDDRQKRLGVVALPEGAIPVDAAGHRDIDSLDAHYAGTEKLFLVKHGENPVGEEKPRYILNENEPLRNGDIIALRQGTHPAVFPSAAVVRNAKTPRAILVSMLKARGKNPRPERLIEEGKKRIVKGGRVEPDPDLLPRLNLFRRAKGLKNIDELYMALAMDIVDADELLRYVSSTRGRVVEVIARESTDLLDDITAKFSQFGLKVTDVARQELGELVSYRFVVENASDRSVVFTNTVLEEELNTVEGVIVSDVRKVQELYWSARALGENVRDLLVSLFGVDAVMEASVSLQALLVRAFEKEVMGPLEAQREGYLPDLKAIEDGVAARLKTEARQVEVRISRNPELIQKDAWALATLEVTPAADVRPGERAVQKAVVYVHEEVFSALKSRAPPERAELLRLLAEHETDEYLALHEPGSAVYDSFGNYLAQEQEIPLTEISAERTAENFHQFLAHLSAHTAEGDTLSPEEARYREQVRLLYFAHEIVSSRARAGEVPADEALLLEEVFRELLEPGAGDLPRYGVLADIHGGYFRLVGLLSSLFARELDPGKTLAEQGITRQSVPHLDRIFILGDLLDRGPEGMKVIRLVQELVDSGIGQYVTGNHDLFAFMNLLGLHLPWYSGYRGIPPDYRGYGVTEADGNIVRLLEAKRAANPFQVNDINLWAQKLSQYMAFADQHQSKQWKPLEARFEQVFNEMYGYNLAEKDVLNKPEGIFAEHGELTKWWGLVMGHSVAIKVYTGVRAAGKMSLNWWLDRRRELDTLAAAYPSPHWQDVAGEIDGIIEFQKAKMDEELRAGNWEWAVIDAMMYRNYESAEWWALDWVYHKGWGGLKDGLLSEINAGLKARGAAPEELLNEANYLKNPDLQKLRAFYMKSFRFYRRDRYGNVYMHSFLPLDGEGDVSIGRIRDDGTLEQFEKDGRRIKGFYYKGIHYAGADLFKGFDRLADDISGFEFGKDPLAEIYEALALVNSLYADLSTRIKPTDLKRYKAIGYGRILDRMGVERLICGHNPVSKLNRSGIDTAERENAGGKVRLIHVDDDMSPGYTPPLGKGSFLEFSVQGSVFKGFVSGEKDAPQEQVALITREEFLLTVLDEMLASLGARAGKETLARLLGGLKRPLSAGLVAGLNAGLVRYLSGQAAQGDAQAGEELARALREAPVTGESGWEQAYERLAAKLLTGEKERRLYEKVDRYYRGVDFKAMRERNRQIARQINAVPYVQEVYGVGFPHYGDVDIRRRNYETLKAVEQGRIPVREFPQRMLPDIDFLVVLEESEEGPWSVQTDMDAKMMDGFVQQAGLFQRPWRRIFEGLAAQFPVINKFNGEGERDPIDLFLEQDKLNIDFVPVSRHIWENVPVFVRAGDRATFRFIRDLMFTAAPLSRRDGTASGNIPLQFRRNFLLNLLDEQGPAFSGSELVDRVIAGHPYRSLIELYPEIHRSVGSLFAEALNDAREKGLVQEHEGMLSLTPKGRKFLLYVLEHRRTILDEGYLELPRYNENLLAALSNAPEDSGTAAPAPFRDAIGKIVEVLPVGLDTKGMLQGIIKNIDGTPGSAVDVSDIAQRPASEAEAEALIAAAEELARKTPMSDAEGKILENLFSYLRQQPPRVILTEGSPGDFFGMGKKDFIVLNREIAANPVAFLHEALESLKHHRPLLLFAVESSLDGASRQWLYEKEEKHETLTRQTAMLRPHYVIRAFTRQVFGDKDEELTEQIRARATVARPEGTAPRSAARTAADREKQKIARITYGMREHTGLRSLREGLPALAGMEVRTPEARAFIVEELARLMAKLQNNVNRDDYFNLRYAVEVVSDMFSDSPFVVPREYENMYREKFNALLRSLVQKTGRGALTPAEQEQAERFCRALDEIRPALEEIARDVRYPNLCGPSAQIIEEVLGKKYGFPAQKYVFTGFDFAQTCVETEVAGFRFYVDGTAGLIINDDGRQIAPVVTPLLDVEEKNIVTYREAAGMKKRRVDGFVSMVEIDRETAALVREVKEARLAAEARTDFRAQSAAAPSVQRTLEEVLRVADPRRAFTGELPAVAAAGLVPERHARMKEEAPELYGKTVLRYYDELSARDMDEMAALNALGVNVVAVLPYLPSDELSGRDNLILERDGVRSVAGLREGRITGEDGRSFGVLSIEGVRPGEAVQVARWLKESPALHMKLQSLLGLEFAALDPAIVEIKTAQAAEDALQGAPPAGAALLYRPAEPGEAVTGADAKAFSPFLDGIVDENALLGLDAAARA
ncbi:MAG: metallophosphoesterase, partial [Endomicrobiales bacterium]